VRLVKFRGKNLQLNKWVYGNLIIDQTHNRIFIHDGYVGDSMEVNCVEVHPESVGQFTGLYDINGQEIYEGDIVKLKWTISIYTAKVVFKEGMFCVVGDYALHSFWNTSFDTPPKIKILGNVFDNPELL